jgi:dCTP deaminase
MILNSHSIAIALEKPDDADPLILAPRPDTENLKKTGAASIDLRLGTWFVSTRTTKHPVLEVHEEAAQGLSEQLMTTKQYVPFGQDFILHPHSFVLAATLEWIRMPRRLAGYVTGKSSWGRRGLVIETAPGVHPGFVGCLTLELANVGQIPIAITPGTPICQLFFHRVEGDMTLADQSAFVGRRQPVLGNMKLDAFAAKLRKP